MVYINYGTREMTILKSKTNYVVTRIVLKNQTDKNELSVNLTINDVEYNKNSITINTGKIINLLTTNGQYNYYLYNGLELVESGILQLNDYETNSKSYTIEDKNIIQYNG